MTRPDPLSCALWSQRVLGAFVFAVDHPDLPECAGAHGAAPCDGSRGKHPCSRWSRDSTDDPAVIRRMMSRGPRNYGIDMGRSGLLGVDEDVPGAFRAAAAEAGVPFPVTLTVSTSKGAHYYFRQPEGRQLGNSPGALKGRGIDIRGAGGYLIGPGSLHQSGAVYMPADPAVPVAPMPGWLIEALTARPAYEGQRPAAGHGTTYGRMKGLVAAVLAAPAPGSAAGGSRNKTLYWAACRAAEMVAAGEVDEPAAIAALSRAGELAGLGPGEVAATIASGMRGAVA